VVVHRNILPGHAPEYDAWLRRFIALERGAPGYLGTAVIVPQGSPDARYIVHHFASEAQMNAWETSPERAEMLREVDRYTTAPPEFERASGLEAWFELPAIPGINPPPKWKMALVLLLGASLISITVRYLIGGYLAAWPIPVGSIVMSAILVTGLTWVLMPYFTRWLRPWLYPRVSEPPARATV
jgi:uncharacterized protein